MANALARLNYRELYQLKWLLGQLTALLSVWTVVYLSMGGTLLIVAAIALIGATLVFPRMIRWIPRGLWKVVPYAMVIFIASDLVLAGSDFIPPLVRMVVLLLLYRTLEYRTRRSDLQLVLLCVFIVVITGVLTMELSFALQILLFTPAAMGVLFLVTLSEDPHREGPEIPEEPWEGFRWRTLRRRLSGAFDRRLLLFAGSLFLGMVAVSTLIFFLLPRFELGQSLPFLRMQAQQSFSGFSESVQFGEFTDILEDETVALRADLEGERPRGIPYWRMVALDQYTGNGFRQSDSARETTRSFSDYFVNGQREDNSADGQRWTVYFEGNISRYLPLPGSFSGLRFQSRQNLQFTSALQALQLRETPASVLFFQLEDFVLEDSVPASTRDRALAERTLSSLEADSMREVDPSYPLTTLTPPRNETSRAYLRQAVAEITGGQAMSSSAFGHAAIAWLQKERGYALQSRIPEGEGDLLTRWMASGAPGHCELYAGSMVLLAREAGFPARLITGFRGGDWNGFENYFMVRNKDAHAWVEMFGEDLNWQRWDPTPGGRNTSLDGLLAENDGVLVDRRFQAYLDSLRVLWYRRIVNFDQRQQREMVEGFRSGALALWENLREEMRNLAAALGKLFQGRFDLAGLRLLVWPVIVILLAWLARRLWRRGLPWGSPVRGHQRIRRQAARWIDRLSRARRRGAIGAANEAWEEVRQDLLVLRFDDSGNWPTAETVFRRARQLLRGRDG
jgi:transglutaminase-like putative cysteine protease